MQKPFKKNNREEIYSRLLVKTLSKLYNFDENLINESFFKLSTIKKEFREVVHLGFAVDYPKSKSKLYTNLKKALGIKSIKGFDLSKGSAFDSFRLTLLGYVENRIVFNNLVQSWKDLIAYVEANKTTALLKSKAKKEIKREWKTFDRDSNLLSDPVIGIPMIVKDIDIVDPFEDIQIFL